MMTNCTNLTYVNTTTAEPEIVSWEIGAGVAIPFQVVLTINLVASLVLNAVLILILQYSPSLKTPPNSHLINICINNILLCISMILAMVGFNCNSVHNIDENLGQSLTGVQLFLVYNALLQYWGTFASIGYYRQKTIKDPGLNLKVRRQVVSRSIAGNWLVSLLLSMTCSLTFAESSAYMKTTLDPFRKDFLHGESKEFAIEQIVIVISIYVVFVIGFVAIFVSYYSIFKTLNFSGTFAKNRVAPWQRAPSLASDIADLTVPGGRSYNPTDPNSGRPFTVSQKANDALVVHYHKCDHSLAFEDILALENPILAVSIQKQKRPIRATLSNGSQASTKSRCPDFTDISMGADLERFQKMKNNSALRNQVSRRDRVSLSSATRNSLVMFCAYLFCSLPLILCSVPRVMTSLPSNIRVLVLLVCRLLFFLNAPVYPMWYLLYSKRVRKCMRRMIEILLIRLDVRR